MKFSSFKYNYHDSQLAGFTLGPRRELTLEIALDPVWNTEASPSASIRFGGIENFEEVAPFFRTLPPPPRSDCYIAEITGLKYLGDRPNRVLIDLADQGQILVQSRNVAES